MTNLEQIKAAWAIGWSAVISLHCTSPVVEIGKNGVSLQRGNFLYQDELEKAVIQGYLYAGELAGNEPIPEGQKFKYKREGVVLTFDRETWEGVKLKVTVLGAKDLFLKSEIEPVFT